MTLDIRKQTNRCPDVASITVSSRRYAVSCRLPTGHVGMHDGKLEIEIKGERLKIHAFVVWADGETEVRAVDVI